MSGFGIIPRDPVEAGVLAAITGAAAKVLLVVCSHVSSKDWTATPGIARIAALTGLSLRAVQLAARRLETLGVLDVEIGRGRGHKTIFRLRGNSERPFTFEAEEKAKGDSPLTNEKANAGTEKGERPRHKKANAHARILLEQQQLEQPRKQQTAADKPPPDPRVKLFIDFFTKAYSETLGRPYIVTGGKDGATAKRLLLKLDGVERCALAALKKAALNMLADDWGRERASVGLLSSQLNTWRGNGTARPAKRGGFTPAKPSPGTNYDALTTRF